MTKPAIRGATTEAVAFDEVTDFTEEAYTKIVKRTGRERGLLSHLEAQRKVHEILCAEIAVDSVVYAELDAFPVNQIVRIISIDGDNVTVERRYAQEGDGWRQGTWTIHRDLIRRPE